MPGLTAHRRLALAVLEAAVRDAHAGRSDARAFLENGSPLLAHWCQLLGIGPGTARRLLEDKDWSARFLAARAVFSPQQAPRGVQLYPH